MNKLMKKILLILGIALMLISCEKHEAGDKFILFSPEELVFDKQSGGTMSITTSDKAFVELIIGKKKNLEGAADSWEFKSFFEVNPPRYTIALEDIKKYTEFDAFGCKVIPDASYRKFTIVVEPNCGYDAFTVEFHRIVGNRSDLVPSDFEIRLE